MTITDNGKRNKIIVDEKDLPYVEIEVIGDEYELI